MVDTKDPRQVGALGGKATWSKIKSKKKRSEMMRKLAKGRFPKKNGNNTKNAK